MLFVIPRAGGDDEENMLLVVASVGDVFVERKIKQPCVYMLASGVNGTFYIKVTSAYQGDFGAL